MNFLELCKKARQEARITGQGPAQVTQQQGVYADIVSAVQDAWLEIQMLHETWRFMAELRDVNFTKDVGVYLPGDFGINDFARPNQILVEGIPLKKIPWHEYLRRFHVNPATERGVPQWYSIGQDGRLYFAPTPERAFNVTFDYQKKPVALTANTDKPGIPDYHHAIIYWRAVMDLAANESDSVIYQKAFEKFDNALSRLQVDFLPPMQLGGGTFS